MTTKLLSALILAAAVTLAGVPRTLMAADDNIFFVNDMDVGVKSVFCAGKEDTGRLVFGPVDAKSFGAVPRSAFPSRGECERLYVHMEDGAGWQFWSPYYEERYAGVLIQEARLARSKEGYTGIYMSYSPKGLAIFLPPGMLFGTLTKHLRLGLRESDWERIAVPGLMSPSRRGEYALRGAGVPWSLTAKGVTYKETAPGQRFAMQAEFVFSGERFYSVDDANASEFAYLIDIIFMREHSPWLFSWNGKTVAFSEEGKRLMSEAALLPGTADCGTPERWESLAAHLASVFAVDRESIWIPESAIEWFEQYYGLWAAIGGKMGEVQPGVMSKGLLVFGNESTRIELELPIGTQKAVMRVIRNHGAAPVGAK